MRVLVDVSAVPRDPVGAGAYTMRLAEGLATNPEIELHLCGRADDGDRWRDIAPDAIVHAEAPARRPARLVWEQTQAPRLAARLHLDVWHGPHYTLPLRAEVPRVVTVHDLTLFDHPEWHERAKVTYFRRMIPAAVRRAAAIVAVSEYTAAGLRERFAPRAPILVAPHGVDRDRFHPQRSGDDLARLRTYGVRPPFVAFAGLLEPRKDVPGLVAAFARIAATRPALRLVLAGGDGWGARAVRDAIAAHGVASRVLRVGYVPDLVVPALFRQAEVVAYPSLVEGYGLPALEALACGAALVSTRGSAVEEVVGDAAVLVTPGDTLALARALDEVLADDSARARLRASGPARATRFTWEASSERHLEAYRLAVRTRLSATT